MDIEELREEMETMHAKERLAVDTVSRLIERFERKEHRRVEGKRVKLLTNGAKVPVPKRRQALRAAVVISAPKIKVPEVREPPPIAPDTSTDDNRELTPCSDGAIRIGRTLSDPFTPMDLRARLDGPHQRAYQWVADWKRKNWIETVGFGQYRKTVTFGE